MKTSLKRILLCSCLSLTVKLVSAKIVTETIYINDPDSSLKANVMKSTHSIRIKPDRTYHWYNKNTIQHTDGGYSGRLLHGLYESFYADHNLLTQGKFDHGLKDGLWISWFRNGKIKERIHFNQGELNGCQELFDSTGHLRMRIYYHNNLRAGKTTIFSQDRPDSVIHYKKGHIVPVKRKKPDTTEQHKRREKVDSANRLSKKEDKTAHQPKEKTKTNPGRAKKRDSAGPGNTKTGTGKPKESAVKNIFRKWKLKRKAHATPS